MTDQPLKSLPFSVSRDGFYPAKDMEKVLRQRREAQKRYRERHPERVAAAGKNWRHRKAGLMAALTKRWREIPQKRISALIRIAVVRARKKGFEYDKAALEALVDVVFTHCEFCKIELNYGWGIGKQPNGPSIDRVDNSRGYVSGNLAILCNRCNGAKGSATAEEHRKFADFIDGWASK